MLPRCRSVFLLLLAAVSFCAAQTPVPLDVRLRLLRAEDTRDFNDDLRALLRHTDAGVRAAAALSAGRIGDERAVAPLIELLQKDPDDAVRQMAAFALGETESPNAAAALIQTASDSKSAAQARAVEALGKIAAVLTDKDKELKATIGAAILEALHFEAARRSAPDQEVILAGLTAALRARPEGAGAVVAEFIAYSNPRLRADALNALARLRAKDKLPEVRELLKDPDATVRANAARVLGGAEDKEALDALIKAATQDPDARVRVAAIRALGALKDVRAVQPLEDYEAAKVIDVIRRDKLAPPAPKFYVIPSEQNEWLEIAVTLGNILAGNKDYVRVPKNSKTPYELASPPLLQVIVNAPEVSIARAKIDPTLLMLGLLENVRSAKSPIFTDWHRVSSLAQGLGVIATLPKERYDENLDRYKTEAPQVLLLLIHDKFLPPTALPDVLRAYAAFKPDNLRQVLSDSLKAKDVIVRATAADLLGDLPPSEENTKALSEALPVALRDGLNDAAMSILGALAKQKSEKANDAIKSALEARDYLVRWRAIDLLKRNGAGDFSAQKFPVKSQWTEADYREALALGAKDARAVVDTDKGAFTIQLRPDAAPLNVLSFVRLARRGYFNGIVWHRVVPNFVIQGGDPRGDGNGGPGYALRCEINQVPYERGAVGMALSGKDTGGSQWFVTHSPQPHLDGGYTVFGNVIQGLETVDKIARGDKIRRVRIIR
jgi:cyclophilin family peptidyl-prolyl cis-trans isomerase/HEAT repeat protein